MKQLYVSSVVSSLPEAMLVRAQAASNCRGCREKIHIMIVAISYTEYCITGLSFICRNWTNLWTTPLSMTCWIGGFFSITNIESHEAYLKKISLFTDRPIDSNRRKCWVELSCLDGSSERTFSLWTRICEGCAACYELPKKLL